MLRREQEREAALARQDEEQVRALEAALNEKMAKPVSSRAPKEPLPSMLVASPPSATSSSSATAGPGSPPPPASEQPSATAMVMSSPSEEGSALGGPMEGDASSAAAEERDETSQPKKKRRRPLNAGDLAINVLSVASEVKEGLEFIGLVDETDYVDIEELILDRMLPDPDYDSDEDLMDRIVHV